MYITFLKVAFRNLFRNRMSTLINLIGLSIAIACCVVSFLFIQFGLNYDTFHENIKDIHMMGNVLERNGVTNIWGSTPAPLGERIKEDIPSVKYVSRVSRKGLRFVTDEDVFREEAYFVEKDWLEMFSFELLSGSSEYFNEPNALYLTENRAIKLFGTEKATGQEIRLITDNDIETTMIVRGVLKDLPDNSSLRFNFIIPYENLKRWDLLEIDDWKHWTTATFMMMIPGHNPYELCDQLEPYLDVQREANPEWGVNRLEFYSLYELTRGNNPVRNSLIRGSEGAAQITLTAIAVILLLLASFNYTNNNIVALSKRYREIGIRKVVGSSKFQLINQLISENLVFIGIAIVFGIVLAEFILIPGLYALFDGWNELPFQLTLEFVLFITALWLLTGIGAALYPSFIVSRFMPVDVFKGHSGVKGQNLFIRIMIGFQFVLTLLTIIVPIGLILNERYQMTLDWGYDQEGLYAINMANGKQFEILESALRDNPNILSIAGTKEHLNQFINISAVVVNEQEYEPFSMLIGPNYIETVGMKMVSGRTFGVERKESQKEEVIVNQLFLQETGLSNPIGKQIQVDAEEVTIVGVVQDFLPGSFNFKIPPMVLKISEPEEMKTMIVKIQKGNLVTTSEEIKRTFRKALPTVNYSGFFQDTAFIEYYNRNHSILGVFVFSGSSALLIAIMGLYGLVSATLAKREKEIGIRKVLGATVHQITSLITKPLLLILLIASTIAMVPGWFVLKILLDEFHEFHMDINAYPFIFALLILFIVSAIVMFFQTIRTALSNPVKTLRNE